MKASDFRFLAAFGLIWVACMPHNVMAQNGPGRLDAAERQRLRSELRQQANEARVHGQAPMHFQQFAPANSAPGAYAAPLSGPGGIRPDGLPRLSPEERQQLRLQLRESRQR